MLAQRQSLASSQAHPSYTTHFTRGNLLPQRRQLQCPSAFSLDSIMDRVAPPELPTVEHSSLAKTIGDQAFSRFQDLLGDGQISDVLEQQKAAAATALVQQMEQQKEKSKVFVERLGLPAPDIDIDLSRAASFMPSPDGMSQQLSQLVAQQKQAVQEAASLLSQVSTEGPSSAVSAVSQRLGGVTSAVSSATQDVSEMLTQVGQGGFTGLTSSVSQRLGSVQSAFDGAVESVVGGIEGTARTVAGSAGSIAEGVVAGAGGVAAGVVDALEGTSVEDVARGVLQPGGPVQQAGALLGSVWGALVSPFAVFGDSWLLNVLFVLATAGFTYTLVVTAPRQ